MDFPTLSLTSWAGLAAAAAMLATFWRNAVGVFTRIADLFIGRVALKDDAARAMMSHVWKNGRKSPFGLRLFGGLTSYVAPKQRVEVIGYEAVTNESLLFWFGRVPLLVGQGQKHGPMDSPTNLGSIQGNAMPVIIRYIRGTINFDLVLEEAIAAYNAVRQSSSDSSPEDSSAQKPKRFNVIRMGAPKNFHGYENSATKMPEPPSHHTSSGEIVSQLQRGEMRLLTWTPADLIERSNDTVPFQGHPVAESIMEELSEISIWLKCENWFRSKGIRWYRGFLLFGPPGSGKSTIVRNVALKHDLPIYVFDLSSYDNQSFAGDWKTVMQNAPAIALLEDLDASFVGREFVGSKNTTRDNLTFDCLLNTISGVGSSDGVLLFITTNKVETLDPALGAPLNGDSRSTRPGRIDKAIYVGPMGEPERRKLAEFILGDWPELIDPTVVAGEGEMAAQFQQRCVQLAEPRFWATQGKVVGEIAPPTVRQAAPQSRVQFQSVREVFEAKKAAHKAANPKMYE